MSNNQKQLEAAVQEEGAERRPTLYEEMLSALRLAEITIGRLDRYHRADATLEVVRNTIHRATNA